MTDLPVILLASQRESFVIDIKNNIKEASFVVTGNGEMALQHTTEHNFSIIIIDSELDEINGYEVTLLLLGAYHCKNKTIALIAPNNDKTAKWKKFNDETSHINLFQSTDNSKHISNEIKRLLNIVNKKQGADELCPISTDDNKSKKILAVDDMSVNLMALEIIVKKLGHTLYTSRSGAEALELCKEHLFDLIFMDCQMPDMDGFETTAAIKELYKDKDHTVPIVALTAHAHREDKDKCLKSGMHDYLTKPVIKNEIIQTINKWTSNSI